MSESIKNGWDGYQVFQVIWAFVTAGVAGLQFRASRRLAKEKKEQDQEAQHKAATEKRLKDLEHTAQQLQNDVGHLPTHADIRRLTDKVENTNKALSEMTGQFKALNHTVQLVNQHLIQNG